MSDPQITREVDGTKGRYLLHLDGHKAELTYSQLGKTQVIADHTAVDDALSGKAAGLMLVERLVADARAKVSGLYHFARLSTPCDANIPNGQTRSKSEDRVVSSSPQKHTRPR
ncbi:Acetyltransferase [Sulfitobacter noctilucicola]|nr:Acetyltransferase [Sulfitobacter noctilucicola]